MRNDKTTADWQQTPPADWTRTSYRRRSLANWITDIENGAGHLLARVVVNRVWHHHFGRGIVATPNDFGLQGVLPSHPELLDHLAQKLIANDWNLKSLHRDILLSSTWLQSSDPSAEKAAIDPDNKLLWRFTPRRLEAEVVRDSILAAAGQLDPQMFGPGTLDEGHRRRSIYFMIKRSRLVPMMQVFDQPEPLASQGSRPSTTIAPQALLFMNNLQVVKWARALASKLDPTDADTAIRQLYLRTLGRDPSPSELTDNRAFFDAQSASYSGNQNATQLALADPLPDHVQPQRIRLPPMNHSDHYTPTSLAPNRRSRLWKPWINHSARTGGTPWIRRSPCSKNRSLRWQGKVRHLALHQWRAQPGRYLGLQTGT